MGIQINPDITVPDSTDAVVFDAEPVTTEQVAAGESTGAVPYYAPQDWTAEHHGADAVVQVPHPQGPVSFSAPAYSTAASVKVVSGDQSEAKVVKKATTSAKKIATKKP